MNPRALATAVKAERARASAEGARRWSNLFMRCARDPAAPCQASVEAPTSTRA